MLDSNKQNNLLSSRLKQQDNQSIAKNIDIQHLNSATTNKTNIPNYEQGNSDKKFSKLKKIFKKKEPVRIEDIQDDNLSASDYDELISFEDYENSLKFQKREITISRLSKLVVGTLVALCLYIAFLIYGLATTNYVYDKAGYVTPEVLSVSDLGTLNEYNKVSGYYLRTRILYEKILKIDYDFSKDSNNAISYSMEYRRLLDNVSKLCTDINAAQLDIGYDGIMSQMYELVYQHMAVYLQNVADAIDNNDSAKAAEAVAGREVIENKFTTLTINMTSLREATKGARNGDLFDWNPAQFIENLGVK